MQANGPPPPRQRPFLPAVQSESCQQVVAAPASGEHGGSSFPGGRSCGQEKPETRWFFGTRAPQTWVPGELSAGPVAPSPTRASKFSAVRVPQAAAQVPTMMASTAGPFPV